MTKKTQVLVIGAGPGGYPAAIKAAQLGKSVTVVERGEPGGVCLNVGCIPSKALISAANIVHKAEHAEELGIHADGIRIDVPRLRASIDARIGKLRGGIRALLRGNGCDYVQGDARFVSPNTVEIAGNDTVSRIEFEHCIIATGSRPIHIPAFFVSADVVDSTGALAFKEIPKHLCIIGGGVIGLEIGTAWAKLGSKVTVIEMAPEILIGVDRDLVAPVLKNLRNLGVTVYTQMRVTQAERTDGGLQVSFCAIQPPAKLDTLKSTLAKPEVQSLVCDKLLVCVGRKPNTDTLNLGAAGVETDERGLISVDEGCHTNVPHIFAIGDTVPGAMLAHKATDDGIVAATNTVREKAARQARVIPAVIFTDPEIAMVGKTAKQVREETGSEPLVGKFPFSANGRALAENEPGGFCSVVIDASKISRPIVGVSIVGVHAGDMISEAALLIQNNGKLFTRSVIDTVHPHPTLPEIIVEAVRIAVGEPLHALPR